MRPTLLLTLLIVLIATLIQTAYSQNATNTSVATNTSTASNTTTTTAPASNTTTAPTSNTTTAPTSNTTTAPTSNTTTAPASNTTTAPASNTTTAPASNTTTAPTSNTTTAPASNTTTAPTSNTTTTAPAPTSNTTVPTTNATVPVNGTTNSTTNSTAPNNSSVNATIELTEEPIAPAVTKPVEPPPKMFETGIDFRAASVEDWLKSRAILDQFSPPEDTGRVYTDPTCETCKSYITDLMKIYSSSKIALTADAMALSAQILCIQQGVGKELSLPCSSFDDMGTWLRSAGLINSDNKPANLLEARGKPESPCQRAGTCSANVDKSVNGAPGDSGAIAVRMKLSIDITQIPHSSDKWTNIVRSIINDVASVLNVSPSRLQLHIHQGEYGIVELVIKRVPRYEQYNGPVATGLVRSVSPLELAVRLNQRFNQANLIFTILQKD